MIDREYIIAENRAYDTLVKKGYECKIDMIQQ